MISIDTNILFHAFNADSPLNGRAYDWLASSGDSEDVAISEFVLAELYRLVRNPVTAGAAALSARAAFQLIEAYRQHPRWMLIGFSAHSRALHDRLWKEAARSGFGYRKLYDVRTALTLLEHGVTEFANEDYAFNAPHPRRLHILDSQPPEAGAEFRAAADALRTAKNTKSRHPVSRLNSPPWDPGSINVLDPAPDPRPRPTPPHRARRRLGIEHPAGCLDQAAAGIGHCGRLPARYRVCGGFE